VPSGMRQKSAMHAGGVDTSTTSFEDDMVEFWCLGDFLAAGCRSDKVA
jgi:hypothetical protein